MTMRRSIRMRAVCALGLLATVLVVPGSGSVTAGFAAPNFSKAFSPDTIGPGSSTTLTFTIDNSTIAAVRDNLAFTDTLPAGVVIASAPRATITCGAASGGVGPTLSAPAGGGTITFSDGSVGANKKCTVSVDVTGTAVGTHMNTSGTLTWTGGNSGTASDDLNVVTTLPGFSKSFSPSTVPLGDRSTLTLTIDNTLNASNVPNLDFTDNLPPGLRIASPANASTDCGTVTIPPTLTATPGTSSIVLDANGTAGFPAVAADATCTVVVDVVTSAVGTLANSAGLLAEFTQAGNANAAITVTRSDLAITKDFTDDPVPPGGLVTLEFRISNNNRTDTATDIEFDDNLPAGLTFNQLVSNDCGGTLDTSTPSVLAFSGGALAPEAFCTIVVQLNVPAGAAPGTYVNTTTGVLGTVGGTGAEGNSASDTLFVVSFPLLTKEFTDDPVGAGGDVTLEFTITNTDPANAMTDIEFVDELTDGSGGFPPDPTSGFLPFPVSVTLPPTPDPPCGGSSSLALVSVDTNRQGLQLTGGSLAAAGSPGDSCTFSVTVSIPVGFPGGTYTNTTESISAIVDGATMVGPEASDDIVVVGAPTLTKEFTDDPTLPGGTVTLVFTLDHDAFATADATAIAFQDDLTTVVAGLTATSVDSNDCGATVDITTDPTLIDVSGGTLTPGATCTITLTLSLDAAASTGTHGNTTSTATAVVDGVAVVGLAAEDTLTVTGLTFTKEFVENPYIAGETGTLRFTLDNTSGAAAATGIFFSDNLDATLSGLVVGTPPVPDPPCGVGSSLTVLGGNFMFLSGGEVAAGASCSFDVPITVPAGAADDTYTNTTSTVTYVGGTAAAAVDDLVVQSDLVAITKSFTNDPALPGGTVTLSFDLTNLSATDTIEQIAFTDDLDAALSGLSASGATANTCGGAAVGMPDAFPTGLFNYADGTLGPGASCNITLTLDVPAGPFSGTTFTNTTSAPTGVVDPDGAALPVGGDPATDTLTVRLQTLTKSFAAPIGATGSTTLSFTITNLNSIAGVTGLSFTDNLDATLSGLVASAFPANPCGAGSTVSGASFLSFSGGSLAQAGSAGDSCTFAVTVTAPASATAGTYPNTTSNLFAGGLVAGQPATDSLVIEPPPTFTKAFAPDTIVATTTSTLTFTIDNTASSIAASSLAFTDNFPAGVVVASPSNASTTCTGGTLTAAAGSGTVSYSGGSVGAGASCTISVDVTSSTPGSHVNTTGDLTSSSGNSGTATDTITVTALVPPTFAKAFAPDTILEDTTSTLTFTIDNTASTVAATGFGFTDTFPAGVVVATPPNASTTCTGGMGDAAAGNTSFSFAGGTVGAGASCTISVDVTSSTPGSHVNTTGDLTSSSGNSGTATDTLNVTPRTPPTVTINQAAGQADPTNTAPINFTVVFNEVVTGFDAADVTVVNGTVAAVTGSGTTYNVAVTPAADGVVSATVNAGAAVDGEGTASLASTSTDNQVTYDATPPVITAEDKTVNNDPGQPGAVVDYTVTATDDGTTASNLTLESVTGTWIVAVIAPGGVTCTPASGSFFPIGTTTVTCTATDLAGNSSTQTFQVTVIDNEGPTATAPPANVNAPGPGPVTYPTPTVTDNSGGTVTVTCTPPSGSTFGAGTTTVTCIASDPAGNTTTITFDVIVPQPNLPATGGGLDLVKVAVQLLTAGAFVLLLSRIGRRRVGTV